MVAPLPTAVESKRPSCVSCSLRLKLEVAPDLEQLAADDRGVGADAPAGVDLALALAVGGVLSRRLQEDQQVLAGHHLQAGRGLERGAADHVGEVAHVLRLERVAVALEVEHRELAGGDDGRAARRGLDRRLVGTRRGRRR